MQVLQKQATVPTKTSNRLCAPIVPAVASRVVFKSGPVQHVRPAVSARIAVEDQLIVSGISKQEMAEMLKLPQGYHWYETMIILKPALNDLDRDRELAKFEAFLNKEECLNITALTRPATRMAYHMKGHGEGIYVLYSYAARRQTARTIQKFLSTPDVGSEEVILRHITFCKSS